MKTLLALLKRELLEYSSVWKVPMIMLAVGVLVKLSLSFGNLSVNVNTPDFLNLDQTVDNAVDGVLIKTLWTVNWLISFVMIVVAAFYALACLYTERQDESILFWRSLPISDSMTVASKLIVALVVIPLLIIVCHMLISIIFLGSASFSYLQYSIPLSVLSTLKVIGWLLLPLTAWCMLCSSVANKAPFLMAFIAPIILVIVDSLFFEIGFGSLIFDRFNSNNHDSLLLLGTGIALSVVCICFAVVKRSQRI